MNTKPEIVFCKWTLALVDCGLVTIEAQLWAANRMDTEIFYDTNNSNRKY